MADDLLKRHQTCETNLEEIAVIYDPVCVRDAECLGGCAGAGYRKSNSYELIHFNDRQQSC